MQYDNKTQSMLILCGIYDDSSFGSNVDRETVELILEGLDYSPEVNALVLEAYDYDHNQNYND